MEPVAPGDEVATELLLQAGRAIADDRTVARQVAQPDVVDLEFDLATGGQPRGDEVLDQLLLPVDRDRPTAGQLGRISTRKAKGASSTLVDSSTRTTSPVK